MHGSVCYGRGSHACKQPTVTTPRQTCMHRCSVYLLESSVFVVAFYFVFGFVFRLFVLHSGLNVYSQARASVVMNVESQHCTSCNEPVLPIPPARLFVWHVDGTVFFHMFPAD